MNIFDAIQLANSRSAAPAAAFAFGELVAYDPTTHTGQFNLPGHPDPVTGLPTLTGFLQLGTPHVGANGSGAQFPPVIGAQAKIAFLGTGMDFPLFDSWYFTTVETPPFPSGTTWGWNDPQGSSVTTTKDGPTAGDGQGGAHVAGNHYTAATTANGHQHVLDDINKWIKTVSTGGHQVLLNDAAKILQHTSAGGHQVTLNDLTNEISHVPSLGGKVNLGAVGAAMSSANAALNNSHLTTFESALHSQRLTDLETLVTALTTTGATGGVPYATIIAAIATLAHISVPGGSLTTNIF